MSLDGKIATKTGDSKYISGSSSRMFVHRLRHRHQAILVGINTILIDHPHLTTRLVGKQGKDAHRIILDSSLKISPDEPVITQSSTAKTIVVTRKDSDPDKKARLIEKGVSLIEIEDPSHPLNLHEMLKKVKVLGIDSILVEGGSTVHFSFIEAHLFQRLFASISPLIIGGDTAKSAVGGTGFSWLRDAMKLKFVKLHHAGNDLIIEAIPQTLDSSHASSILPRGDKP
jgi:diaminohydroxyphosphoribosylaminopyrimidine deaminase/5-amino-6-(5-phosphoribosylamino)uracil reductase